MKVGTIEKQMHRGSFEEYTCKRALQYMFRVSLPKSNVAATAGATIKSFTTQRFLKVKLSTVHLSRIISGFSKVTLHFYFLNETKRVLTNLHCGWCEGFLVYKPQSPCPHDTTRSTLSPNKDIAKPYIYSNNEGEKRELKGCQANL